MPRYGLRSLLIATAIFALCSLVLNSAINQQRIVALIESKGGKVSPSPVAEYNEFDSCFTSRGCCPLYEFGKNTVWNNLFHSVQLVELRPSAIDEQLTKHLNELPRLEVLYVGAATDTVVNSMAVRFPNLQITNISPESSRELTPDQLDNALKSMLQWGNPTLSHEQRNAPQSSRESFLAAPAQSLPTR